MNTQIAISVAELKEALPGLTKVIGRSRTLTALQTVRVTRTPEGVVTLHATDLDSFITYTNCGGLGASHFLAEVISFAAARRSLSSVNDGSE
jgi:hypothetical protein